MNIGTRLYVIFYLVFAFTMPWTFPACCRGYTEEPKKSEWTQEGNVREGSIDYRCKDDCNAMRQKALDKAKTFCVNGQFKMIEDHFVESMNAMCATSTIKWECKLTTEMELM